MSRVSDTSRWEWLLASAVRCHLIGAAVTLSLAVATGWVITRGDAFWKTLLPPEPEIGLAKAAALIEQQPRWEKREAAEKQRQAAVLARVDAIRRWLPESVDWPATQQELETLAGEAGISLLDLEPGDPQVGARVGVLPVTCRLRGTYPDFCRLLHALAQRQRPIWCHEIRVERAAVSPADGAVVPGKPCLATLSLRLPYAAAGSAAGQLLREERRNEQ